MVKEARQNLEEDEAVDVCDIAKKTYDLSEEIIGIIDEEIKANKNP